MSLSVSVYCSCVCGIVCVRVLFLCLCHCLCPCIVPVPVSLSVSVYCSRVCVIVCVRVLCLCLCLCPCIVPVTVSVTLSMSVYWSCVCVCVIVSVYCSCVCVCGLYSSTYMYRAHFSSHVCRTNIFTDVCSDRSINLIRTSLQITTRCVLLSCITSLGHCYFGITYFSSRLGSKLNPPVFQPGPRLNIKTVLSTYGDFHVKDKTAVRTSYL